MKYKGSHFTSFLPLNHWVVRGRLTILRNYVDTTYRYFYPCLLFECSFCYLPATVTIETSFLVLLIESREISLRSFNTVNRRNPHIRGAFFRAHWYRLLCCKASVKPASSYKQKSRGTSVYIVLNTVNGRNSPGRRCILQISSERTGTDFSAV